MIRRPPRSTLDRSSAASDVYKRQALDEEVAKLHENGIRFRVIGDLSPFDPQIVALIQRGEAMTAANTALTPVSYTHLRAHETVLDLVCRLLLDNKPKYTTPHTTHNHIHIINTD